ncbi:disease resistance protein RPP4-like isoform X1 [Babesia caballi]|uniref:Disease resistance protein RPP4-like isoform X1 n=1 Tax=Babesia caballi TaxID=5871 RepID=A0AAV4M0B9_BABCB|nr:disease resistance protein RPP4-like isoform X1 [Babesia caballi]
MITAIRHIKPAKPLEEADDEVQHGVADLVLCDVRRQNAAASDLADSNRLLAILNSHRPTLRIIPNELLKSLGQLADKAITRTTRCQSLLNLPKFLTKRRIGILNFFKKLLNLLA